MRNFDDFLGKWFFWQFFSIIEWKSRNPDKTLPVAYPRVTGLILPFQNASAEV
jgi:hypothetical protein